MDREIERVMKSGSIQKSMGIASFIRWNVMWMYGEFKYFFNFTQTITVWIVCIYLLLVFYFVARLFRYVGDFFFYFCNIRFLFI